ncbi:MAG: Mitochondrial chaperone Frataxin [Bogoriella megaspora]|nr:MAG: Mitochondrial chaperone Frataxin [Bogoriella megaspora]
MAGEKASEPTPISDEEYHELADQYLDNAVARLEEMQESREDLEVEFSAGVLTVSIPDKGTYVINKQPPNKQIWLSSPITGPKRYDWVMSDGMNQKEGTGQGDWVYLRDGSNLTDLLSTELDVTWTE